MSIVLDSCSGMSHSILFSTLRNPMRTNTIHTSIYEGECPGCGTEFIKKRSNQVFCNSRCKNQYHNGNSRVGRIATKERHEITKEVDDILWKNRKILLKYENEISISKLEKEGFRTDYISKFKLGKSENENIFYIYDVAYKYINQTTIKILNHGK